MGHRAGVMRSCALLTLVLLLGCADKFLVIKPPSDQTLASVQERVAAVREALASFGLHQVSTSSKGEIWCDPGPRELRVTITVWKRTVSLHLREDFSEAASRIDDLEKLLLKNINERFGKGSIYLDDFDWDPS